MTLSLLPSVDQIKINITNIINLHYHKFKGKLKTFKKCDFHYLQNYSKFSHHLSVNRFYTKWRLANVVLRDFVPRCSPFCQLMELWGNRHLH